MKNIKDNHDIGELYRNAFQDYSPEIKGDSFARIHSALRKQHIRKQTIRFGFGGAGLLALLFAGYMLIDRPQQESLLPDNRIGEGISIIENPAIVADSDNDNVTIAAPQNNNTSARGSNEVAIPAESNATGSSSGIVETSPGVQAPNLTIRNQTTGTLNTQNQLSGNSSSGNSVSAEKESSVSFSNDTTICLGTSADLSVYGAQFCLWGNGQTGSSIRVEPGNSTSYSVEATGIDGKVVTGRIMVKVEDCANIFIPNGFTPNGDGLNDVFKAGGFDVEGFNLRVFSRNGELVFESSELDKGWSGDINGSPAAEGAYIYIVSYLNRLGVPVTKRGSVTLLR